MSPLEAKDFSSFFDHFFKRITRDRACNVGLHTTEQLERSTQVRHESRYAKVTGY